MPDKHAPDVHPFTEPVLAWYDRHARTLPWRIRPQDGAKGIRPDPYHVWLSEVMLQQTTVAAVKSYFEAFIERWPTVDDLAAASSEGVMAAWAGLGYYSRARNLKACAEDVAARGGFPKTQKELQKLPGIGDYTSAAIAAIAFGEPAAVVDGNVERVVTRYTADATPLPKAREHCRRFMAKATPGDRPGDFVQAMMDLGATICTPRNPVCSLCPVQQGCTAREAGTMLDYPVKPAKKAKPTRRGAAFAAFRDDGAVWLIRRPASGLLGGMAALPSTDWSSRKDGATEKEAAPFKSAWQSAGSVRHTFTHFHLELDVWWADDAEVSGKGHWSAPGEEAADGLPGLMQKALVRAQASREEAGAGSKGRA